MLRSRLEQSLKEAILARNERAVSTLRLILAALKDRDIAERSRGNAHGLDDGEIQTLLLSMIRQRRESIDAYEKGARPELARQEAEEIAIIEQFLPKQLTEEEAEQAVIAVIEETEAKSLRDMGRVMATLKGRFPGQLDFAKVGQMVRERLS